VGKIVVWLVCSLVYATSSAADERFSDPRVRAFFADVLRLGGFGFLPTERAAFLVVDPDGDYRCVLWVHSPAYQQQSFSGPRPAGTIAIIHTHPKGLPEASSGDRETAIQLALPIIIVTPRNIRVVTTTGESTSLVTGRLWAPRTDPSSGRCSEPKG
jgi:hypothetical protein